MNVLPWIVLGLLVWVLVAVIAVIAVLDIGDGVQQRDRQTPHDDEESR